MEEKIYDTIILGAGPAGLSAAIYAGRAGLDALLIEKLMDGGQLALTAEIENYPGAQENETGASLIGKMSAQADKFGAERKRDEIIAAELSGKVKKLIGGRGEYLGKTVIIAAGASHRPIGCKNEESFIGRGISYCATCDGAFFKDLEVFVAGGGDSAAEEAIYLTRFARKVTIIHRRNELRAASVLREKAFSNPKINFLWDSVVEEVNGGTRLNLIKTRNVKTGELTEIRADEKDGYFGLFGFIGMEPQAGIFTEIAKDESGCILTDENMKTNIEGVYAAGDIRAKTLRQAVTAAADGAVAAVSAEKFIQGEK